MKPRPEPPPPFKPEPHYGVGQAAKLVGVSTSTLKDALAKRELEHRVYTGKDGQITKRVIAESELIRWFHARTRLIVRVPT